MTVNVCLEEFCNIGKLPDFKRVLNFCRGSGIFCQSLCSLLPQLQDRYPKPEWEELIGCTDIQICLGCNDVDTANLHLKKCGMVTIKVENNQMPLLPLFSPVYSSTRPYSQTKSNTQRALMLPDEIMRMDNQESLVLLRGQKPLKLYKITPDEHPSFQRLHDVKVSDYTPEWRRQEETAKAERKTQAKSRPAPSARRPVLLPLSRQILCRHPLSKKKPVGRRRLTRSRIRSSGRNTTMDFWTRNWIVSPPSRRTLRPPMAPLT